MKTFELHSRLRIRQSPDEVFGFFSDAANLDVLTPDWLHFRILTDEPVEMRRGVEIDYRLRLRGLPIRWRSRITAWQPPFLFVDEQIRGPYRLWIHEHHFRPNGTGTIVEDRVRYAVWGGPGIERLVNRVLVASDLARIFEFRRKKMAERFSAVAEPLQE